MQITELVKRLSSGEKHTLSSPDVLGVSSMVKVFEFTDGSRMVLKQETKTAIDYEVLALTVAKIFKVCVPEWYRLNEDTILLEYIDGSVAEDSPWYYDKMETLAHKRMRVLDQVIGNSDRHSENWMIDSFGRIVAIDHGLAFSKRIWAYGPTWHMFRLTLKNVYTPAEIRRIERELKNIAALFFKLDYVDEYYSMMHSWMIVNQYTGS